MAIFNIAHSLADIDNHVVVKISYSENKQYIGIRTQNSVLFLAAPYSDEKKAIQIIDNVNQVPSDLLVKLDLQFGLVSTKDVQTTR